VSFTVFDERNFDLHIITLTEHRKSIWTTSTSTAVFRSVQKNFPALAVLEAFSALSDFCTTSWHTFYFAYWVEKDLDVALRFLKSGKPLNGAAKPQPLQGW